MNFPKTLTILLCLSCTGLLIDGRPAGAGLGYGYYYYNDADLIDETPPKAPSLYKGRWELQAKPHPQFKAAEKEMKKKNFRRAERKYNRFIKAEPGHIDVPQATFQRARALFKLSSFDESLKLLNDFLASKPGLLWEARCRKVLHELYNQMPHYAFRRGKKLYYNREHREGQQIYVWNYNRHQTVRQLETARLAYSLLIRTTNEQAGARKKCDLFKEAMDNNLALTQAVQARGGRIWDGWGPEQDIEPPQKNAEYDFAWPGRTKIIFLLEEVDRKSTKKQRAQLVIEARHQKAVFLMAFPEMPPVEWQKKTQKKQAECNQARKNGDPVCLPEVFIPVPRLDPLELVESIVRDYPQGPHLDRSLGTTARIYESRSRFLKAEELYEKLIKQYPKSKYVGDARASLYELRRRWISVHSNTVFAPGKKREVSVTARNLKTVSFAAYRTNLKKALASSGALLDPSRRFVDFEKNFGRVPTAKKWFGRKVASWKYTARDRGDHVQTMGTTEIPFEETGAYLVHARSVSVPAGETAGAKGGGEEHVFLVVLTDRVMVGKQDRGKVHYWITDAQSGQPVADMDVVVKETYWLNNSYKVRIGRYQTDEFGRASHQMVKYRYASSSNVEALAHEGRRFAFSNRQYCYSRGRGRTYDQNRIFTVTDRPVYRPGDQAHFKLIVRGYHQGKNENVPGVRVRVKITNPRGEILYDQTRKTDKYGALHGTLKLDEEATLGVYRVNSWVEKGYGSYQSSGSNFRVEEYKKPEFKVTVTPSLPDARMGARVTASIQGRYYFGPPVAHARVQYQIYRQPYWHVHYPPSRYDWLYGQGYGIVYERPFEQGTGQELVQDGHGTTDEAGRLKIDLPPAEKDAKHDYLYTVQVQMTDLSRRTIHGKGEVKVTRDPFHIFARTPAGFYSPGDRVEIEVEALTPQDRPVQAQGSWTVYRLTYPVGEKEKAEKLESHPLKTGASGRSFVEWKALEVGHYRVAFALQSGKGPFVEQKHYLYVTEGHFDPGRFKFQKITLKTEKRTYLRGEKIRLMVGIPKAGGSIWLSQEGGDEIFEEQVFRLEGTGRVIEIPADETRAPNFFARVTYIDDGEIFTAQHEVFIPPGEEILNVILTPDQATRRPGEKGSFKIKVTDHRGKPVKGQINLSVFDESVLYIQGDTTGDIRSYYYGDRRYLGLWLDNSLQIWHLASHWSPKRPRFKPGGLPPAGAGWFSCYGRNNLALDGIGFGSTGWGYGRGGGGYYMRSSREATLALKSSPHSAVVTGALSRTVTAGEIAGADARFAANIPMDATAVRGRGEPTAPVSVREFFADTALWIPALETDDQGRATAELSYPDSVTTWKGRAFVIDRGRKVGMASVSVVTTKRLVARIETPRFLVEGDRLVLAAVIHNGFDRPVDVDVRLQLEGLKLLSSPELRLKIPARSEMRHDFPAYALKAGPAKVRLIAASARESDALEKTLPVLEWGAEKLVTAADTLKQAGEIDLELELPKERKDGSATLTIEASPSLGGVLLRSLPYLIRYPYGCIEQTISRFVPAAVVSRTLKEAGVKLEQLKPVRGQATMARHLGRLPWYSAVNSSKQLDDIIRRNLRRIASMQNPDGGFGWFSGTESDPYMTAYAIMGLHEAQAAGHPVDQNMLRRAVESLHAQKEDLKANHLGVFVAYAVGLEDRPMPDLLNRAYFIRDKFSPYGQSLLALALFNAGMKSKARQVADNLADLAWVDEANHTATFKAPPSRWWLWWFNRVEANAWALRALVKIRPDHPHVDRFATWLLRNRSGNRWTNTKDTSMAVLALTRYMKKRGELNPNATITVLVNGRKIRSFRATKKTVLGLSGTMVIPDQALASGPVHVKVKLSGRGQVYATAFLEYFTKERKITGSGYEIGVERSYSRLIPQKGSRKTWSGTTVQIREYDRAPLKDGDRVKSGDLIEVRIAIESKNDYSYLVFEDFKPAGMEAVALKSGSEYAHGTWTYRELRDEKVVHFLCSLPQGTQVLTYRLRAEIPGTFRVLPHRAYAMYVPRIKAISDSATIGITD